MEFALFVLISDDCGDPGDRDFATASFNFTWYNNTANFSCNDNYAYSGNDTWKEMTCQEDGSWSTIDDNCKRKHCLIYAFINFSFDYRCAYGITQKVECSIPVIMYYELPI